MKKIILSVLIVFLFCCSFVSAQDFSTIADPKILSIDVSPENPNAVIIKFDYATPTSKDKAKIEILDSAGGVLETLTKGRSKSSVKEVEYAPARSGKYTARITGSRTGEKAVKGPVSKEFNFLFPLSAPSCELLNMGNGSMRVTWNYVNEAGRYEVSYKNGSKSATIDAGRSARTVIEGLTVGEKCTVTVSAVRGSEKAKSKAITKTVIAGKEREWKHTWFGQSTKEVLNTMEMIDADNLKFKLSSCTYDPESSAIIAKGGKFTAYHDGVSFYYTEVDAAKENFDITCTVTVDYINPSADGQEGFGIVCYDHLGKHGVFSVNHYTNSVAILATKMEERFGDTKKTSKDTLGVRFTQGVTPEAIKKGDAGIAESGRSEVHAFSYDGSDLVKAGDVYKIRLKKDNSGYTCYRILKDDEITEETLTEFTMWGPEKLLQLDPEHVYVGFAVARGCNATFSDISIKITDPKTDPPRQEEPPKLINTTVKVDSPIATGLTSYVMNVCPNCDGTVTVSDASGKVLAKDLKAKAAKYCPVKVKLVKGINDFIITFKPDENYRPGEKMRMAQYDKDLKQYVETYKPLSITHSVTCMSYAGKKLYVSPFGNPLNTGTKDSPLDLTTAINYSLPGQPIIMLAGVYNPTDAGVNIVRGNDGTAKKRKVLKADDGCRPVIDFSTSKKLAFLLYGDYWTLEGFDITNSPENVKGLQIGGHNNIVRNIEAYLNGDTGIQIAGMSVETKEWWPTNNLVENCSAYGNADPAGNNADGFAAKLTCGAGNVFRGCMAWRNIDDGWDLYSKIETGPIDPILIENSVSFENGMKIDATGKGDGNGFKLGGDGIAVAHTLKNSISFANGTHGITCNSDPAIILINCTTYGNADRNVSLYGKGKDTPRMFQTTNTLSLEGGSQDEFSEQPTLVSSDDYFWNGAQSKNGDGVIVGKDIFESTDIAAFTKDIEQQIENYKANPLPTNRPGRNKKGEIDLKGLFKKNSKAPKDAGASL